MYVRMDIAVFVYFFLKGWRIMVWSANEKDSVWWMEIHFQPIYCFKPVNGASGIVLCGQRRQLRWRLDCQWRILTKADHRKEQWRCHKWNRKYFCVWISYWQQKLPREQSLWLKHIMYYELRALKKQNKSK